MEFVKICFDDINDVKHFNDIYLEAFPKSERYEISTLQKWENKFLKPYFIKENSEIIAICVFIENKESTYILYLAVKKEFRNKGIGTKILDIIKEHYSTNPIIFSIEDPSSSLIASKRYNFYLSKGFFDTNFYYKWYSTKLLVLSNQELDVNKFKETYGKLFNATNYSFQ